MRHPNHRRTLLVVLLALLPIVANLAAVQSATACTWGAAGIGDAYFPTMGNGGYDVTHYDLDVDLDVERGSITVAAVTIDAIALADLCAFNLDFEGLTIDEIKVDGETAEHDRWGKELTIRPESVVHAGDGFSVTVRYHGTPILASRSGMEALPGSSEDAALGIGGADPGEYTRLRGGWFVSTNEIFVLGEPTGNRFWYPVNEHPADKASYTATYTVAEPFEVVANGKLVSKVDNGETTSFEWDAPAPMASYLVTFHAAVLEYEELTAESGMPIRLSFAPNVPETQREVLRRLPEMVAFAESTFGPYPFETLGATVTGRYMPDIALETQTLPIYGNLGDGRDEFVSDLDLEWFESVVFHELAHQWFGNSVSVQQWDDAWLNEGFATYADVLWIEHAHGAEARDDMLATLRASSDVWYRSSPSPVAIGDPGSADLFAAIVYDRGALTLHALRLEVGDETFFALLQTWTERYRHGTVSTADFVALAEEVSERDIGPLFDAWLFQVELPPPA